MSKQNGLDYEDMFFKEYGYFPSKQELKEYIDEVGNEYWEEEAQYYPKDNSTESDIDRIIARGDALNEIFGDESQKPAKPPITAKIISPSIIAKPVSKETAKEEKPPRRTRGLNFKVRNL